ncbi:hypothetical protein [Coriobacterium glomerans]|nr:hypothetical protein [Coriobacterium glomerans]
MAAVATTYSQTEVPVDYSISRDRGDLSLYKVHLGYWSTEQVPDAVS